MMEIDRVKSLCEAEERGEYNPKKMQKCLLDLSIRERKAHAETQVSVNTPTFSDHY